MLAELDPVGVIGFMIFLFCISLALISSINQDLEARRRQKSEEEAAEVEEELSEAEREWGEEKYVG